MATESNRRLRPLFRALAIAGGATVAFVAVMGFLHTPYGRPFMRRLGMTCPARNVSPAAAEALRLRGVRALRGAGAAPSRPALGLELDGARLPVVQAWAAARGGSCTLRQQPSLLLTCRNVGDHDELAFAFATDGRLVSVAALREGLPPQRAAALFDDVRQQMTARLGDGALAGDPTAASLAAAPLRVARLQFRFSDYLATVTAMNLPGGVALREQYQSARD